MNLYDLVSLRQQLKSRVKTDQATEAIAELRDRIREIAQVVGEMDSEHQSYVDQLVAYYDQLIAEAERPLEGLALHLAEIDQKIDSITHRLFNNNYILEEQKYLNVPHIRDRRRIVLDEQQEQMVKQRILLHTGWRYPALEIGCRDGEWTRYMVAADPLYIVDQYREFLDSAGSQFTPEYQRRLRPYHISNHNLSQLPQGQFAFIFSWSYFNYVSMDTMKIYLQQIFNLLRPGGVFLFSFNDGDTPAGASMAEKFVQTYMPRSFLESLCQSLGFDVNEYHNPSPNVSWLEIQKPGVLHTTKAHQVLGEIIRRD